MTFGIIVVF